MFSPTVQPSVKSLSPLLSLPAARRFSAPRHSKITSNRCLYFVCFSHSLFFLTPLQSSLCSLHSMQTAFITLATDLHVAKFNDHFLVFLVCPVSSNLSWLFTIKTRTSLSLRCTPLISPCLSGHSFSVLGCCLLISLVPWLSLWIFSVYTFWCSHGFLLTTPNVHLQLRPPPLSYFSSLFPTYFKCS